MTRIYGRPRDEDFAYGGLRVSNGTHDYCIGDKKGQFRTCNLDECDKSSNYPYTARFFHYNPNLGIEHDRADFCFEKKRYQRFAGYVFKKNKWNYSFETKQIIHEDGVYCIQANFENRTLKLKLCDEKVEMQIWNFGFVNETMVERSKVET